ncbi:tape measure protein [Vibrio phage S4-7]|nr:tape measure protein [Vibrio phage S4-7]
MARDMFKFVNTVGWKNDLESFRRLKKEVRGFKKEIDNLYKGINKNIPKNPFMGGGGSSPNAPRNPRPQKPPVDDTAKFTEKQDEMIKNFMISNRQIRQMSEEEKEILRTRLKQTSSVKELRYEMRKIKTTLSDNLATQKKFTREQQKQNALAKRANASYMQLGTSIASVYTALAAGQSIVRTGIAIESINKTLLSVTGNSTLAAEEMKFLESEAARLGLSLQDGGKAYAKLLAAGKGKLPTEDIRDMFTAVSEAGTVLGLSQDDMSGGIRA